MTRSVRRLGSALLAAPFIVALSGAAALAAPANANAPTAHVVTAKSVTPDCMLWGCTHPPA